MRGDDADIPILTRVGRFVAEAPPTPDAETLEWARLALIDILGCMLVGASEDVSVKARAASSHRSGTATVHGTVLTLSPEAAAFANAVAAHAIDYDDWEIPGNSHPTAVIVPALLAAIGDRVVSGRDFADAYLVGFEIIARLGEALNFDHYDAGWHTTATFGPPGAAAAVARLWGLDAERSTHAVAIAISRAGGLTAQFGSDTKPLQAGFAAEAGLVAASLAKAGLTAQPTALEGPSGYAALTAHGDIGQLEAAFASLGAPPSLKTHGLVFKPYPSCGYTHRILDAALELRRRGVDPTAIETIDAELPTLHAAVLPFHAPANAREARFSLPFCAALALTRGRATVADFTPEVWESEEIVALMARTTVRPFRPRRPELNYDPDQPDRLTISTRDGGVEVAEVAYPLGSPWAPMSAEAIMEKFRRNAGPGIPEARARDLADWLSSPDISTLLTDWS